MTHTAATHRETILARYNAAWNDLLAAQRDIVDALPAGEARRREQVLLDAFVSFREAQMDYYTFRDFVVLDMQTTLNDVQATVNDIRTIIHAYHAANGDPTDA